jgi:hypothetical protein
MNCNSVFVHEFIHGLTKKMFSPQRNIIRKINIQVTTLDNMFKYSMVPGKFIVYIYQKQNI